MKLGKEQLTIGTFIVIALAFAIAGPRYLIDPFNDHNASDAKGKANSAEASESAHLTNIKDKLSSMCKIKPALLHINLPQQPDAKLGVLFLNDNNDLVPYALLSQKPFNFKNVSTGSPTIDFTAEGSVDANGQLGIAVGEAEFKGGKKVKVKFSAKNCKFSNFYLAGLQKALDEPMAKQMIKDQPKLWIVTRVAEGDVNYTTEVIKNLDSKASFDLRNSLVQIKNKLLPLPKVTGESSADSLEKQEVKTGGVVTFAYELRPVSSVKKDSSTMSGATGFKIELGESEFPTKTASK